MQKLLLHRETPGNQTPIGRNAGSLRILTHQQIQASDFNGLTPEFGRTKDVERYFGIKRGTLYTLNSERKVRSVLLRIKGQKSGVRLWDMSSISGFIRTQMEANNEGLAA